MDLIWWTLQIAVLLTSLLLERLQRRRGQRGYPKGYRKLDHPDSGAELPEDRSPKRRRTTTGEEQTKKGSHNIISTKISAQWVRLGSKPSPINVNHNIHDSSASHHQIGQSQPLPSEAQDEASNDTVQVDYCPRPTVQHSPGHTSKPKSQATPRMRNLNSANSSAPQPSLAPLVSPESSTTDCMLIFRGSNIERICPLSQCQTVNEFLMNATLAGIYQGPGGHLQCVLSSGTTKHMMTNAYNREQDFQMLKATIEEEKSESAVVTEWRLT